MTFCYPLTCMVLPQVKVKPASTLRQMDLIDSISLKKRTVAITHLFNSHQINCIYFPSIVSGRGRVLAVPLLRQAGVVHVPLLAAHLHPEHEQ